MMRTLKFFMVAAMMAVSVCANAQGTMKVVMKDGSESTFTVGDIEKIVWNDGASDSDESTLPEGLEAVDLGLPSGTKWANMNLGAETPEGYGSYFAFGETKTKSSYNWENYVYCDGTSLNMTKYCTGSNYGTVDNKSELELEDDAAYVCWGADWRMPSKEQFVELFDSRYTSNTWTEKNGVKGRLITSNSNGNSIFIPAAGWYKDDSLLRTDTTGSYLSRTLFTETPNSFFNPCFTSDFCDCEGSGWRCWGNSVRPVYNPE